MRDYSSENILKLYLCHILKNDKHPKRTVMNTKNWIHYYRTTFEKALNLNKASDVRTVTAKNWHAETAQMGSSTLAPCSGGKRLVHHKTAKKELSTVRSQSPIWRQGLRSHHRDGHLPDHSLENTLSQRSLHQAKKSRKPALSYMTSGAKTTGTASIYWVPTVCQASQSGLLISATKQGFG